MPRPIKINDTLPDTTIVPSPTAPTIKRKKTGRPSTFSRNHIAVAKYYIENYKEYGDVIPMVAGLAMALGISRETVYQWAKDEAKYPFSDLVLSIMTEQERQAVNNGLSGAYNPKITAMILAKHGYTEKQENQGVSITVNVDRGVTGQTITVSPSDED